MTAAGAAGLVGGLAAAAAASTVAAPRIPVLPEQGDIWGESSDRYAVVLGVGGVPGAAWEAATVAHLQGTSLDPQSARLIVGTSAGSLVAAFLRAGIPPRTLIELATLGRATYNGTSLELPDPRSSTTSGDGSGRVWSQAWQSLSVGRLPRLPATLAALVPARGLSLAELGKSVDGVWSILKPGEKWPQDPTWICAVDTKYGQRTVFGIPGEPAPSIGTAVAASCAVPGVFTPVLIGDRRYMDGAVAAFTSVDLAVAAGARRILVLNPLTGRTSRTGPTAFLENEIRTLLSRTSQRSLDAARARGVEIVEWFPSPMEAEAMGASLLDFDRGEAICAAVKQRFADSTHFPAH